MEIYLYRLVKEQGTSISEIARQMGVTVQYISNVARGQRVSIKILERIAAIIDVPAWRLLCPPEDDPISMARPEYVRRQECESELAAAREEIRLLKMQMKMDELQRLHHTTPPEGTETPTRDESDGNG